MKFKAILFLFLIITIALITPVSADTYYNEDWSFRFPVTVDSSMVNHSESGFPVKLWFNSDGFNDNATDLRVTDSSGNELARQVEFYNSTTNNGTIFFNVTALSNTSNDLFYIYGGNPGASEPANDSAYGCDNVWDGDVENVYLFDGDGNDSTANNRSLTEYGDIAYPEGDYGIIAYADWTDDNKMTGLNQGANPNGDDYQITARFKKQSNPTADYGPTLFTMATGNQIFGSTIGTDTGYPSLLTRDGDYTTFIAEVDVCDSEWHTLIFRRTGTEHAIIIDGFKYYDTLTVRDATTDDLYMGIRDNPLYDYMGFASYGMVLLESTSRDDYYEDTRHNNLNNPTNSGVDAFFDDVGVNEYYTDSLYYNATDAYNLTIYSDGNISSNRSIVAGDDTNWTAFSTDITNWVFTSAVSTANNTYFTITGDNLDNFTVTNLTPLAIHALVNSSGVVEDQTTDSIGTATFDENISSGDYWITALIKEPVIILLSQTPSTINQSSVGNISIKYGITHEAIGLNNTSISFVYRNYDHDLGCSNHSIRVPDNNLAAEWSLDGRILRGANRNETLNFENNDTITGGDIYSWSGLDENSSRMNVVPVNSTYTLVWVNGTVHDLMPQMWYLDRTDLQEAPKTQVAIHKTQDVLIKFWSLELFKGNTNYIGVGYTDTALESNPALHPLDADPVEFYYINSSYDPDTDGDPLTSGYAVFMGSGNASAWIDHVYSPHPNSNYVTGFIDNNLVDSVVDTSETAYLYFKSDTPSSKPYYINMTNIASSTNVSFADTDVLWSGAGAGTFTQLDYTPNVWFSFMKINMSFDHMLYAADNYDQWDNSTLNSTVITEGEFFPTTPVINHFHYPDYATLDTDMDGLYNGTFDVGIAASTDPDGGVVTMNLTLHYENGTFVAVINNTVTSDDIIHNGVFVDVEFDSSPYYSNEWKYTMKIVATDDESYQSESWLSSNFTLSNRPIITSYTPTTPTTSIETDYKAFEIFINQDANVTWYLDTIEVFNETWVSTSNYNNSTAILGVHNVTVYVENDNGSTNQTWVWTVAPPIKFMPVSVFLMWIVIMIICFIGAVPGMYQEEDRIKGMIFSIIGVMDGFMLTDTAINGKLVTFFGHVSTDNVVLTGRDVVQNSALHWIVLFITLIFIGITVYITIEFIREKMKPVLEEEA